MSQGSTLLGLVSAGLSLVGLVAVVTTTPIRVSADDHQDRSECEGVFPGDGQGGTELAFGLEHGPALRYKERRNGTFTDKNTGLQWEQKTGTACPALCPPHFPDLHDVNNFYEWTSGPVLIPNGELFTVFLTALNTPPCFAGHCDWRIPTVKELQSLIDYSKVDPATSVPGATKADHYWSSTTHAPASNSDNAKEAWVVDFHDGSVGVFKKGGDFYARAVRGDCE